eukprot:1134459-Pelagomonas_calceolata.AAC.3
MDALKKHADQDVRAGAGSHTASPLPHALATLAHIQCFPGTKLSLNWIVCGFQLADVYVFDHAHLKLTMSLIAGTEIWRHRLRAVGSYLHI